MSTCVATSIDIALLGCGNVGAALARLAARDDRPSTPFNILGALVRDTSRARDTTGAPLTANADALLASGPTVVVELLGGIEPARRLLLAALERRIPVVTANKTLLARHGAELRDAARDTCTPLLYEAAVIAGVPFLGTFARRPSAAAASSLTAIANGTSNFILTSCAREGCGIDQALAEAQRRGYAEPDPRNDVTGVDSAEKLAVLLQHFASLDVHPTAIETVGIEALTPVQLLHAQELGGVIKPVIHAEWASQLSAFAGPAFVPARHPLARVEGVDNALLLERTQGRLLLQGPGAGPEITAATVLDDVREVAEGSAPIANSRLRREEPVEPETEWLVTIRSPRLPIASDVADLLCSHGIYSHRVTSRRTVEGWEYQSLLAWPVSRPRLERGLRALRVAAECSTAALRAFGDAA